MKARQVKPQFWRDSTIAKLPPALRLFYIGTWMLADDAGVMQYDLPSIAADLYPYEPVAKREKETNAHVATLQQLEKLVLLPCGRHALVPSVPEHPMGGRPTDQYQREHQHRCVSNGQNG